jgi:hypothetical protein
MTRRAVVIRLVVACGLGVLSTVGVAWGFAVWSKWDDPRIGLAVLAPRGSGISSVSVSQVWQTATLFRTVSTVGNFTEGPVNPPTFRDVEVLDEGDVDTGWGAARRAIVDRDDAEMVVMEEARGWPWLCLYLWRDYPNKRSGGAFLRIRGDDIWGSDATVLPSMPIWRGVVLNTGLYGVVWAAPLFAWPALVGLNRRRRGRCPKCSYELRGDLAAGCPECGWRRTGVA